MNRSNMRAWAMLAGSLGLVAGAVAQTGLPADQDWINICLDPTRTTHTIFSNDWAAARQGDDLFGVTVGLSGTVTFEVCFGTSTSPSFTSNVAGGLGFNIGPIGSVQDEAVQGLPIDNYMMMQFGMPSGVGANWGYAKLVRQSGTAAATYTSFVPNGWVSAGASDRYIKAYGTLDNTLVTLRADVIGDAARFEWTLENLAADPVNLGLWFGQGLQALGPQQGLLGVGWKGFEYVRIPGSIPITLDRRFGRIENSGSSPRVYPMPPYVNFGLTQAWAFGLQVVTQPTEGASSALADQTPVDFIEVGGAGLGRSPSLLGAQWPAANDRPMSPTYSFRWLDQDTAFVDPGRISDTGYIQRWEPTGVGGNGAAEHTRKIVAYYRSTTGVSDYAKPYSVVVDAPKTIALSNTDPTVFNPARSTIRVYVDNTRGYTTAEKTIALNDVRITVDLPQGMVDANDPAGTRTRIVQTIPRVEPNDSNIIDPSNPIAYRDFFVTTSPDVVGTKYVQVTVEPQPGPKKILSVPINVASQPRLIIRNQANLIGAPWQFADTSWGTILGSGTSPLVQDIDYQAFTWDAQRQEYVLQSGPQRGKGTFIVSSKNVGSKPLAGSPATPSDLASGAPLIQLKSGWNLIANPYNYPFELGQIVGVPGSANTDAITLADLISQNIISGSFAYWDQNTQSYKFISSLTDEMAPNVGYWVFVRTAQDVTLKFPPVFTPFVPRGTGGIQAAGGWRVGLVAKTARALDDQAFIGTSATSTQALKSRVMEPPIAPVAGAVSGAVLDGSTRYAQLLRLKADKMNWDYVVNTRDSGQVTITWPTITDAPSNYRLTLTDPVRGTKVDMRKSKSFTFVGRANSIVTFKVTAENTVPTVAFTSLEAKRAGTTMTSPIDLNYVLAADATTNVRILLAGKEVTVLGTNLKNTAGSNRVRWNLTDKSGAVVKSGTYAAEVKVTGPSGAVETKTVFFLAGK